MGVPSTVSRQMSRQRAISRNVGESTAIWCVRMVLACVYLVKAVCCGISAIRSEQLGSEVVYNGRRCFVSNWAGSKSPTLAGEGFYMQNVPRSDIRSVFNCREIRHRFVSGFGFYMTNWHGIDVQSWIYR